MPRRAAVALTVVLGRMARRCKELEVPLVVVLLPDFDEHFDESYRTAPIHAAVRREGRIGSRGGGGARRAERPAGPLLRPVTSLP